MIPMPYRSTLAHWQNRLKVRDFLESQQVTDKHRRYLKNRLGVDVFADPPAEIELPMSLLEVLHPRTSCRSLRSSKPTRLSFTSRT